MTTATTKTTRFVEHLLVVVVLIERELDFCLHFQAFFTHFFTEILAESHHLYEDDWKNSNRQFLWINRRVDHFSSKSYIFDSHTFRSLPTFVKNIFLNVFEKEWKVFLLHVSVSHFLSKRFHFFLQCFV